MTTSYLLGDDAANDPRLSTRNSLWGNASYDFVKSLKGDVILLATNAGPNRIFGAVELQAALDNHAITSLGGVSTETLRSHVPPNGDLSGVLQEVQTKMREDLKLGVFKDAAGKPVFSEEFAKEYHLKGNFQSLETLSREPTLQRVTYTPTPPAPRAPSSVERGEPPPAPRQPAPPSESQGHGTFRDPHAPPPLAELPPGFAGGESPPRVAPGMPGIRPGTIAQGLEHGNAALTVGFTVAQAAQVGREYQALSANSNYFAANAMLRREGLEFTGGTLGSVLGGAAAGAGYGALAGAPTGPGALVTGAVGAFVGGFGGAVLGDSISDAVTQSQINHQTASNGQTYVYKDGAWKGDFSFPAPPSQVPLLDCKRTEAITDLAMANTPHLDPDRVTVHGSPMRADQTWLRQSNGSWQRENQGGTGPTVVDSAHDPALTAKLDAISAQRTNFNQQARESAAKAFVTDYYGKGWDKLAPLPDAIAKQLHLKSETNIVDPVTRKGWDVSGDRATNSGAQPSSDELKRILHLRDEAVASNHQYGANLIQQNYDAMRRQPPQTPAHPKDSAVTGQLPDGPTGANSTLAALGVSVGDFVTIRMRSDGVQANVELPREHERAQSRG